MVSECKLVINVTIKRSVSIVSATWYSIKFMKFRISGLKKRSVQMSTPLILSVITDFKWKYWWAKQAKEICGISKKTNKEKYHDSFLFVCLFCFTLSLLFSNLKAGILISTMYKTQINLTPFSWMTSWLSLSKRSLRCRSNTLKTFKNCWTKQIRDCKKWRQNTTNRTVLL